MSAILSADDLNDFISPGVACIKPVETLPPKVTSNSYEVILEDKAPADLGPAQISLTDCLACSGCVTSAEAVLVSLQSHNEVLTNLDSRPPSTQFIALVSPQTRASLAATYNVSEQEAGYMISQLLSGPSGILADGKRGFDLVLDTDIATDLTLHYAAEELLSPEGNSITKKKPLLTSACPGFICYLESTHPALIPHLSTLKSPQAILGTIVKTLLQRDGPAGVYVVGVMPCFDKKLEGARGELTSAAWGREEVVRDVDCVITTRELISLAVARGVEFSRLPRTPVVQGRIEELRGLMRGRRKGVEAGTSGGYLDYIVKRLLHENQGAEVRVERGRNVDTVDYVVYRPGEPEVIARLARCYGFRNIQNLVRRLKPAKTRVLPRFGKAAALPRRNGVTGAAKRTGETTGGAPGEYVYVEVMACPGGCTNGGGQVKFGDEIMASTTVVNQKEWLARVEEAYYSASEEDAEERAPPAVRVDAVQKFVNVWEAATGIRREKLLFTSYRKVENDIGGRLDKEEKVSATVRAAELAGKAGGGW